MTLFCDFHYIFRSSRSTVNLLTVVSDRTARGFNRLGATRTVALDIPKYLDRVWYPGLLRELMSHEISGHIFGIILRFLSSRRVALDGNSSQEYRVNSGIP